MKMKISVEALRVLADPSVCYHAAYGTGSGWGQIVQRVMDIASRDGRFDVDLDPTDEQRTSLMVQLRLARHVGAMMLKEAAAMAGFEDGAYAARLQHVGQCALDSTDALYERLGDQIAADVEADASVEAVERFLSGGAK